MMMNEQDKRTFGTLALGAIIFAISMAVFSGCATGPSWRPDNTGIVGLDSELVGWESPPPLPGVALPRQIKVTAHNGSEVVVKFVMACGPNSYEDEEINVILAPRTQMDYFFTVAPSRTRTTFGCHIVRFGDRSF